MNGKPWPFLKVEPRVYRLQIINMAGSRDYSLKFIAENAAGDQAWVDVYLILTDGGLLQRPRKLNVGTLLVCCSFNYALSLFDTLNMHFSYDPCTYHTNRAQHLFITPGERFDILIR